MNRQGPPHQFSRRTFLQAAAGLGAVSTLRAAAADKPPIIDTHMHVWSGDLERYPFAHPFVPNIKPPKIAATVDLVLKEAEEFGITHYVLVQTIYNGWDNRYLAECVKAHPRQFRGHGLIDPTDPKAADKLVYWMREQGLAGMRFSPIYYKGKDDWLNAAASNPVWEKAAELGAVFNFFIATQQLPKLEDMVRRFPRVPVIIDHLARIDLKAADPMPEFNKLLALARHPNVWVKMSELSELSPSRRFPFRDLYPWVLRLYDAFGPDRLLWGTGYPGATRAQDKRPSLQEELDLIRNEIPFFTAEDRAKILGINAARLWKFT
jgi:predicted TIM-barrel fold metal-dependent hydrolase